MPGPQYPPPSVDDSRDTPPSRPERDLVEAAATELVAVLASIESEILQTDEYRSGDSAPSISPFLVDLIYRQYTIIEELKRRELLLRRGISWISPAAAPPSKRGHQRAWDVRPTKPSYSATTCSSYGD